MVRTFLRKILIKSAGGLLPVILPPLHILALFHFWREYGRRVNRQYCSCSCWDTIFKGTYESGIASYKHLYFNATSNTVKIWVSTVVCILLLYECCKHIVTLMIERRARYLMCILFLSSLFAHYYTWWVYVNYWNDDFYSQWNHQLFFTITELISTILVLHLADSSNTLTSRKVSVVISIAVVHILAGGLDQFLANVVYGQGLAHQVLRDLCFMIPDILHVVLPTVELLRGRRKHLDGWCDVQRDIPLIVSIITGGCALSYILGWRVIRNTRANMATETISTYKVLVLGDSNVGKTCIVHRFCDESYYDTYISTIGVDFKQKIIDLDGMPVKLQIWDTAGQERFRTLTTAYYRGAMGILLMYDVTNLESFNNLGYWLRNIQENASPEVIKVLAGNKSDAIAQRAVRTEDGEKLSNDFDIPLFEVSCKANVNIGQVFLTLARQIRLQRENRGQLNDVDEPETFNVNQPKQLSLETWKSCC